MMRLVVMMVGLAACGGSEQGDACERACKKLASCGLDDRSCATTCLSNAADPDRKADTLAMTRKVLGSDCAAIAGMALPKENAKSESKLAIEDKTMAKTAEPRAARTTDGVEAARGVPTGVAGLEEADLKVTIKLITRSKPTGGGAKSNPDALDLGDASEDGASETLDPGTQVAPIVQANASRLARCLLRGAERSAQLDVIIRGNGRVSDVRVNGSTSSPLAECMGAVMKALQFPTFNGPRTRATFDISI